MSGVQRDHRQNRDAVIKSAASAASPELDFQAVIKSATGAASPITKSRGPRFRAAHLSTASRADIWRCPGAWPPGSGLGMTALIPNFITAWKSSSGEAELGADLITTIPNLT